MDTDRNPNRVMTPAEAPVLKAYERIRKRHILLWVLFVITGLGVAVLLAAQAANLALLVVLAVAEICVWPLLMYLNWRCPACGRSFDRHCNGATLYCCDCGTKVSDTAWLCPECRGPVNGVFGLRFCPKCGVSLRPRQGGDASAGARSESDRP